MTKRKIQKLEREMERLLSKLETLNTDYDENFKDAGDNAILYDVGWDLIKAIGQLEKRFPETDFTDYKEVIDEVRMQCESDVDMCRSECDENEDEINEVEEEIQLTRNELKTAKKEYAQQRNIIEKHSSKIRLRSNAPVDRASPSVY